jgi:hypothetical protein
MLISIIHACVHHYVCHCLTYYKILNHIPCHTRCTPCRYTKVEEIQIKPNPKRAASTAVAVASEAEKVGGWGLHSLPGWGAT